MIIVSFRIVVDDYLIMAHNAGTYGIGIPDYIRRKVTGKALPRFKVSPYDRKIFVALSRIGNNLNQLTKRAHLWMDNPIALQEELLELRGILNKLVLRIIDNDSKSD